MPWHLQWRDFRGPWDYPTTSSARPNASPTHRSGHPGTAATPKTISTRPVSWILLRQEETFLTDKDRNPGGTWDPKWGTVNEVG